MNLLLLLAAAAARPGKLGPSRTDIFKDVRLWHENERYVDMAVGAGAAGAGCPF